MFLIFICSHNALDCFLFCETSLIQDFLLKFLLMRSLFASLSDLSFFLFSCIPYLPLSSRLIFLHCLSYLLTVLLFLLCFLLLLLSNFLLLLFNFNHSLLCLHLLLPKFLVALDLNLLILMSNILHF